MNAKLTIRTAAAMLTAAMLAALLAVPASADRGGGGGGPDRGTVAGRCGSDGYWLNDQGRCGTGSLPPPAGFVYPGETPTPTNNCKNPNDPTGARISIGRGSGGCPRIWCPGRTGYLKDGCGGGGGNIHYDPCASSPYCRPPPAPAQPAQPAKPARPSAPLLVCSSTPTGVQATATAAAWTANSSSKRYEFRLRWVSDGAADLIEQNGNLLTAQQQAAIDAAQRKVTDAQGNQAAATAAAAEAATARTAAENALAVLLRADAEAFAAHSQATEARTAATAAATDANQAEDYALQADGQVASIRPGPAPTRNVTAAAYTASDNTAKFHADAAKRAAAETKDATEDARLALQTATHLAPQNPTFHAAAIAAADAAWADAQTAADQSRIASQHAAAAEAVLAQLNAAVTTAANEHRRLRSEAATKQAAADAAAAAADVASAQAELDQLRAAATRATLRIVDLTARSAQISTPLIASFDAVSSAVTVRTAVRASASNAYGTSWSPWSQWSPWSDWSYLGGDRGDAWDDTIQNGRWDPAESFSEPFSEAAWPQTVWPADEDGNKISNWLTASEYDPPLGCPVPEPPTGPPVDPGCPADNDPADFTLRGPRGRCWPPDHYCATNECWGRGS